MANKMLNINQDTTGCNQPEDENNEEILEWETKDGEPFSTCSGRSKMLEPLNYGCTRVGGDGEEEGEVDV